LQLVDQNIRKKTDDTMREIKENSVNHIKDMMNS